MDTFYLGTLVISITSYYLIFLAKYLLRYFLFSF